jgi:23S rRNA pseudouridine1911/1915/1917 synthase
VAPTRLDVALIRLHPELSRRKAREVIEKGQVDVDGRTVQEAGHPVEAGSAVHFDPNRRAARRARLSLPILYGDAHLLVIDKPAGLLAVPTAPDADEDTALRRVHDYARHLHPNRPYVGVVHRIDRDTSGALAFALTPAARAGLRSMFREHRIERRYAALVQGRVAGEEGIVDKPIHEAYTSGRRRVARPEEPSLPAVTRWRVVERLHGATLLEVELQTGRQHQIRIHLAHLGHPIVGDAVYVATETGPARRRAAAPAPRQMLHARVLGFRHPATGADVRVESPLPEDFRAVLRRLRDPSGAAHRRRARR